jgi:peroxiredoxin
MRKTLAVLALGFALVANAAAAQTAKPAPDFTATDIAGHAQALAAYKGKIVVLEWNNPDCPFVKKHYGSGNMQALQHAARAQGVVWLAVNSGASGKQGNMTADQAETVLKDRHAEVDAYILDPTGALGHLYGATSTPHMFVIDKDGNLAYSGAIDDKPTADPADVKGAKNYVKAALDALESGKQPEVRHIAAYGCGVKYAD